MSPAPKLNDEPIIISDRDVPPPTTADAASYPDVILKLYEYAENDSTCASAEAVSVSGETRDSIDAWDIEGVANSLTDFSVSSSVGGDYDSNGGGRDASSSDNENRGTGASTAFAPKDGSGESECHRPNSPPASEQNESTSDEPRARQIVSIISAAESYSFRFHEDELDAILGKIPPECKVSVVSIVGEFRTGKSFLMSWFLRYLMEDEGSDDEEWYDRIENLNRSFDWRGGAAGNTQGVWMWDRPFFLPNRSVDVDDTGTAVLLVDTQGMFDHETPAGLTAAIFGLTSLLSSYQIYNVAKKIREDDLQQLALFSEYGRVAWEAERGERRGTDQNGHASDAAVAAESSPPDFSPFQRIEFLVRDWQNFETEDETDVPSMEMEMSSYLEDVLADRAASDLKTTREQIRGCFADVGCFALTHPGFAVAKVRYDGSVGKIDPLFLRLMHRYCRRVFGDGDEPPRLRPKTIRGKELTADELGAYVKAYAAIFEDIGANFPSADTMIGATTRANSENAIRGALKAYAEVMDPIAGFDATNYVNGGILNSKHAEATMAAIDMFETTANFGSKNVVNDARDKCFEVIEESFRMYRNLNAGRTGKGGDFCTGAIAGAGTVLGVVGVCLIAISKSK